MECGEVASAEAGLGQGSSVPPALMDNPQARLTVVVEVESGRESGPEDTCCPTLLLEGPQSICLLQPETLDTQEAEQELLARVQSTLGLVARGYSVSLLLRGRETETPRLVPQLLQMLFEETLPHSGAVPGVSTLSLVQLSPSGKTQDLLSPGRENLSVLDVSPLGLVVENASEVEVSDSRAASELYLQAAGDEGRACSLLTVTMSCPGPDPPEGPGTRGMWRGALRILQLPRDLDCPLLQVLAGKVIGEDVEGSLPWIVSWLLEGNNYTGLLLRLDPQGGSLSLLRAALLGASGRRMQVKQVRPTQWDAVEEARARRANLKSLRSGLLGDTLTESGLSQLGRALRELRVVKAWSQCPGSQMLKGVKAEAVGLPELQVIDSTASHSPGFQGEPKGVTASLGPGLRQKHPPRDSEEQAQRKRLQEQHQIWIQEELKRLEQEEEEVEGDQVKGLVARKEAFERQRWQREQTLWRLQLEALQAERDTAEQDLMALYDMHVQAARARTCHTLQVFRAWRGLWEEQTMTTEHHHRSLLAGILQDTLQLATQNQELQAQNQQLQQGIG
ncbi:uncharacterized protein LOC125164285 [Prionailurus viverrinus]|uniref:uncharacterized protein LOC125164285 n=1 Tax=Prionailurus viverrinus TaxID=61388 RepID=UPI001FF446C8|nr:uncharacterized protein LOC125164285 [Prionailurus viverrinus]